MLELQIDQKFGRIGLNITPPQYQLNIKPPDLRVTQTPARIALDQPAAIFEIDYTAAHESLGYYGLYAGLKILGEESRNTLLAGIERRVREGNQLGAIEKKVRIQDVVKEAVRPKERDLQIVSTSPLEIRFQTNLLAWNAEPGGVKVGLERGSLGGEFEYGKVRTFLEQEPYLNIRAVGSVFNERG